MGDLVFTVTPKRPTEAELFDAINLLGTSITELRNLRAMRDVLRRIADLKLALADQCPICKRTYRGSGAVHDWQCPVGMARDALEVGS